MEIIALPVSNENILWRVVWSVNGCCSARLSTDHKIRIAGVDGVLKIKTIWQSFGHWMILWCGVWLPVVNALENVQLQREVSSATCKSTINKVRKLGKTCRPRAVARARASELGVCGCIYSYIHIFVFCPTDSFWNELKHLISKDMDRSLNRQNF